MKSKLGCAYYTGKTKTISCNLWKLSMSITDWVRLSIREEVTLIKRKKEKTRGRKKKNRYSRDGARLIVRKLIAFFNYGHSENVGARGTQSQRDLLAYVSPSKSRYFREECQRRCASQTQGEKLHARETMEERQQGLALLSGPNGLQRFLQSRYVGNVEIS